MPDGRSWTMLCDFGSSNLPPLPLTQAEVQGQLKQIGEKFGTVMQGSYSYEGPEGQTVTVTWTADENGFRAESDAIPVAPSA